MLEPILCFPPHIYASTHFACARVVPLFMTLLSKLKFRAAIDSLLVVAADSSRAGHSARVLHVSLVLRLRLARK